MTSSDKVAGTAWVAHVFLSLALRICFEKEHFHLQCTSCIYVNTSCIRSKNRYYLTVELFFETPQFKGHIYSGDTQFGPRKMFT